MSHNPGPWSIGGEYDNRRDEIEGADGRTVAVVWTRSAYPGATARPQFKDWDEGKANAALIAAAPELLAALTRIVNDTPIPGEDAVLTTAGYNQACDALKKARGG